MYEAKKNSFWGRVYISEPDMTVGQGHLPRINRKNGWIKPVFLLGKSVLTELTTKISKIFGVFAPYIARILNQLS